MRQKINIFISFLILFYGCSNPNSEFIAKIKQQVKKDANGVELNYKNIKFEWTDTLYLKQQLQTLNEEFINRLKTITNFEYYIPDNFEKGMIFTKDYLTKDRLIELRNFQNKVREYMYPKSDYETYYEWLFTDDNCESEWCNTLRNEIFYIDSIINNYNDLEESDLDFLKSICWHYKFIDSYYSDKSPDVIWDKISTEISELKEINEVIDSLSNIDPHMIINYKALNTYKINNPILNGAEQELTKYFIFNSQFEIIGKENYDL